MTTETIVASDAATEINAPEVAKKLEVATPEVGVQEPQDAKEEVKPQLSPAEKEAAAKQRRIDRLTRERYQRDAENEQLRREVEQLRNRPDEQQDNSTGQRLTDDQARRAIEVRARELVETQSIYQKTDVVSKKLEKALGADLDDFYGDIKAAGVSGVSLVRSAIELDSPAEVLAFLGKNPDEMDKVLDMNPNKQATYLGRIEARIEAEKKQTPRSSAPTPLTPVKGSASSNEPDMANTAAWIKWSNERDALKNKRR